MRRSRRPTSRSCRWSPSSCRCSTRCTWPSASSTACAGVDYPKDKLEIQVLDDSTDETVRIAQAKVEELTERGFNAVYLHRTNRVGYKAGALEEGLKVAKGDFVLVFDADFVPTTTIIKDLIHFFTDDKVGMVQARWGHLNKNYSMLTRVQSMMLDGHFVIEHIARNRSGRFFNFNGTAGMWRKQTIEDAGGWHHDTLTEDMDLSFRAQLKGWQFVYVPDALAPAEIPCEMNSFKTQQFRWAKGSAQTAKKLLPVVLKADLPIHVKIEALFHLTNNFAYVFLIFLAILQLPNMLLRQSMSVPELLLLDVPLFAATSGAMVLFYLTTHRALYNNLWEAVRRLPLTMALGIGLSLNNARAVFEGLVRSAVGVRAHPEARRGEERRDLGPQALQGGQELLQPARVPDRPLLRSDHRPGRVHRRVDEHPVPAALHGRLPVRRRAEPLPGSLARRIIGAPVWCWSLDQREARSGD